MAWRIHARLILSDSGEARNLYAFLAEQADTMRFVKAFQRPEEPSFMRLVAESDRKGDSAIEERWMQISSEGVEEATGENAPGRYVRWTLLVRATFHAQGQASQAFNYLADYAQAGTRDYVVLHDCRHEDVDLAPCVPDRTAP